MKLWLSVPSSKSRSWNLYLFCMRQSLWLEFVHFSHWLGFHVKLFCIELITSVMCSYFNILILFGICTKIKLVLTLVFFFFLYICAGLGNASITGYFPYQNLTVKERCYWISFFVYDFVTNVARGKEPLHSLP